MSAATDSTKSASVDRYLDLLIGCLTRELFVDTECRDVDISEWPGGDDAVVALRDGLRERGWRVVTRGADAAIRHEGRDWPPTAETMVGHLRLANVAELCRRALDDDIPGDFCETGVWRGGVTILMRGVLAAYGIEDRTVWVADSFQGLPVPNGADYPADAELDWSHVDVLKVSADDVRANFERYGLLDDRVRFLEGWFSDTLPDSPIDELAVLRLDGDLYESTMDSLVALYPRVSPGGFVIVDDYHGWRSCQDAVDDYRNSRAIEAELHDVDWTGVWWRKPLDED